jgi:hypothetical protein
VWIFHTRKSSAGFQPAVSRVSKPANRTDNGRSADLKSAIQQVGNLRYGQASRSRGSRYEISGLEESCDAPDAPVKMGCDWVSGRRINGV